MAPRAPCLVDIPPVQPWAGGRAPGMQSNRAKPCHEPNPQHCDCANLLAGAGCRSGQTTNSKRRSEGVNFGPGRGVQDDASAPSGLQAIRLRVGVAGTAASSIQSTPPCAARCCDLKPGCLLLAARRPSHSPPASLRPRRLAIKPGNGGQRGQQEPGQAAARYEQLGGHALRRHRQEGQQIV